MPKALLAKPDNFIVKHGAWLCENKKSDSLAGITIIVIILILPSICTITQAQANMALSPSNQFSIPVYNGNINFEVNGTYSTATFEDNTWIFTNLQLTGSQPLENFQISSKNSNVTIVSYVVTNNTAFPNVRLRYVVDGKGQQILNLGLGIGSEDVL